MVDIRTWRDNPAEVLEEVSGAKWMDSVGFCHYLHLAQPWFYSGMVMVDMSQNQDRGFGGWRVVRGPEGFLYCDGASGPECGEDGIRAASLWLLQHKTWHKNGVDYIFGRWPTHDELAAAPRREDTDPPSARWMICENPKNPAHPAYEGRIRVAISDGWPMPTFLYPLSPDGRGATLKNS